MLQLLKAIEESRKKFKELKKDGKNPMFKNNFSTITNIFDSCKSALEENGINVSFHTYVNETIQKDVLVLTLTHLPSGEAKTSELMLIDDKRGAQAVGSAITYHRRYMLQAMLNLEADGETDDDGNEASKENGASKIPTLKTTKKEPEVTKENMTAKNLVDDFKHSGEPYRIWVKPDQIETYNDIVVWGKRLNKVIKDMFDDHPESLTEFKSGKNEKEVNRILDEIKDYQDKDQKWKDAFSQGLKQTFFGNE